MADCLSEENFGHPTKLLRDLGGVAETVMGGSSGAMYSIFFEAAAASLQEFGGELHHHPDIERQFTTVVSYKNENFSLK